MVYDWFNRTSVPPGQEPADGEATAAEPAESAEPAADPSQANQAVDEEDPLEWARQAYARLKAQKAQEALAVKGEQPAQTEQAVQTEQAAPAGESSASSESAPLSAPAKREPEPEASSAVSPDPAPTGGLSLLEQAAARRQERREDLERRSLPVDPVEPAQPAQSSDSSGSPALVSDGDDLQLGAFDDTFTWSAEVLAAQGRRAEQVSLEEIDWLGRLRRGLEKTRQGFVTSLLENLGDDPLTPEVVDDLEALLLRADAGVQATDQVMEALRRRLNEEVVDPREGIRFLKEQLRNLLEKPIHDSGVELLAPERGRLNIWLMVGVNGVGKTTTLGKLANLAVRSGYSALVAAADTFRAAAVQQVAVWADRSDVPVVSNPSANADPAAVVFDAIGAARSRNADLLLVDTAGRLQTKHNLMEELQKIRRIVDRLAPEAKVESLLVLDASQGQNGLKQAMAFAKAADLTGVVITKLDGTARGGVALAVASEAGLPIRFIGAGEGIRDLRPFNSFEFVEALLAGR